MSAADSDRMSEFSPNNVVEEVNDENGFETLTNVPPVATNDDVDSVNGVQSFKPLMNVEPAAAQSHPLWA